jgi:peptide/nickel transport system substrate-binding protein
MKLQHRGGTGRSRRRAGVIGLAVALIVSACGGTNDVEDVAPAPTPPPAIAPAPPVDQVLRIAWPSVVQSVDPEKFSGLVTQWTATNVMGTLLRYDPAADRLDGGMSIADLELELAESIVPLDDRPGYRITLRQGVLSTFGNELTSEDVRWSFERIVAKAGITSGVLFTAAAVDRENPISVVDRYTFDYNLLEVNGMAVPILHYNGTGIFDSTTAKANATTDDPWASDWLGENSASFGPFKVESLTPSEEVVLVRNEDYWRGVPTIERVIIRAVPEAATRVQLLLSGDVDIITDVPFSQLATVEDTAGVKIETRPHHNMHNLVLNNVSERLQDPRVRRAISHAIDRAAIATSVYGDRVAPALSGLPSAVPHPTPSNAPTFDPTLAKSLLADAGYPDGFDLKLTINTSRPGAIAEDVARLIQANLGEVGIRVTIDLVPGLADFETAVSSRELEAWLYTQGGILADPAFLFNLYNSSTSFLNNHGYSNPEFDLLIKQMFALDAGAERDAVAGAANQLFLTDMPMVYLVEVPTFVGMRDEVVGYVGYPHQALVFTDLSITG